MFFFPNKILKPHKLFSVQQYLQQKIKSYFSAKYFQPEIQKYF